MRGAVGNARHHSRRHRPRVAVVPRRRDPGKISPYAAPARARDLGGLPPAFIETAEHDPLRDEGILYALRLLGAGVPVELHQYPDAFHGSVELVPDAASSREALTARREALRAAFGIGRP